MIILNTKSTRIRLIKLIICLITGVHFCFLLFCTLETLSDYTKHESVSSSIGYILKGPLRKYLFYPYSQWVMPIPQTWNMFSPNPPTNGQIIYLTVYGTDLSKPDYAMVFPPNTSIFREKIFYELRKNKNFALQKSKFIEGTNGWFKFYKMHEFIETAHPIFSDSLKKHLASYVAKRYQEKYGTKPYQIELIEVPWELKVKPFKMTELKIGKEKKIEVYEIPHDTK
jgi:hypothetical protein